MLLLKQVCKDVAVVMELLEFGPMDVGRWYSVAVRLADIIASDDVSLHLHEILKKCGFDNFVILHFFFLNLTAVLYNRSDLKTLLDGISAAAFSLLKLDPSYQLL